MYVRAEREVLEPRHEPRVRPAQVAVEVEQRVGHRLPRAGVRIRDAVLAGVEVRRVDHRVDGVDVPREAARLLPDPEIARRRETEHVHGRAHVELVQLSRGELDERAIVVALDAFVRTG